MSLRTKSISLLLLAGVLIPPTTLQSQVVVRPPPAVRVSPMQMEPSPSLRLPPHSADGIFSRLPPPPSAAGVSPLLAPHSSEGPRTRSIFEQPPATRIDFGALSGSTRSGMITAPAQIHAEDVEALCADASKSSKFSLEVNYQRTRLRDALKTTAIRLGTNLNNTDDLVQDVIEKVLRECESFRSNPPDNISAYVFTMLKNRLRTERRKDARASKVISPTPQDEDTLKDTIDSAEAAEIRNAIEKLVPMLTDREKQVLYHLALGKSAPETSRELFIGPERVREIRQQIVKKLLKITEGPPQAKAIP